MLQLTIWSLPALIALILAGFTFHRIHGGAPVPGVNAMLWLCVCVMVWTACQLGGTLVTQPDLKLLFAKFETLGSGYVSLCWFVFSFSFARRRESISRTLLIGLAAMPTISIALAFSNEAHGLMWLSPHLESHHGYVGWQAPPGPWFQVELIYSYALVFAGTGILAFELSASRQQRKALVTALAAPTITGALNLLSLSPHNPFPGFDFTPLGFAVAALLIHDGVIGAGILDAVPVIRHRVVEQLSDGVIVINHSGRITDLNPAAAATFGIPLDTSLPQRASDYITTPLLPELLSGRRTSAEITFGNRAHHVAATLLSGDSERPLETALVFRDITERRNAETALKKVQQELERYAHTDSLTGLANRRFFMQRLSEESERVMRETQPLSVLVFDLDYFKRVNDTHGHAIGDRVLQVIASVTQEVKRLSDVAARIGGEEFAILLPGTDQAGAIRLAQRLRRTISDQIIADGSGRPIRVTASIGVATMTSHDRGLEHILTHADHALYRAKDAGRNMVCTADNIP
jgi:diguanylate cyclase (GGDEF)-like protein